jgi:hypothetical protein
LIVPATCARRARPQRTLLTARASPPRSWSNAKALWANAHPMSSEELITKQAEMVYAQDPGLPGYAPRVWAYRNTINQLVLERAREARRPQVRKLVHQVR